MQLNRKHVRRASEFSLAVERGFVPGMHVGGLVFANRALEGQLENEMLSAASSMQSERGGGFIPALQQIANVATLPGIVGASVAMPDVHSGYGFAVGNVAAFDMDDPAAIVSPGGVGFDINCGVRMLRTNLKEEDVRPVQEQLAQSLFDHIPVGVGSGGHLSVRPRDIDQILQQGMDWTLREG